MSRSQLRSPKERGDCWFHVNNLNDPHGRIWTVQFRDSRGALVQLDTRLVVFEANLESVNVVGQGQPRAYLQTTEPVTVTRQKGAVIIRRKVDRAKKAG